MRLLFSLVAALLASVALCAGAWAANEPMQQDSHDEGGCHPHHPCHCTVLDGIPHIAADMHAQVTTATSAHLPATTASVDRESTKQHEASWWTQLLSRLPFSH